MRSTNEKVKITFKHSFFWDIRDCLRNDYGDGNENDKKAIGLISKTTTLHVHCAFCKFSFPSLHGYDVKLPTGNFSERISRFKENVNTWDNDFLFLHLNLDTDLRTQLRKNSQTFQWQNEQHGTRTIKFETARMLFLSEIFAAVAFVVPWGPHYTSLLERSFTYRQWKSFTGRPLSDRFLYIFLDILDRQS